VLAAARYGAGNTTAAAMLYLLAAAVCGSGDAATNLGVMLLDGTVSVAGTEPWAAPVARRRGGAGGAGALVSSDDAACALAWFEAAAAAGAAEAPANAAEAESVLQAAEGLENAMRRARGRANQS
jgi:TPR repeat protein